MPQRSQKIALFGRKTSFLTLHTGQNIFEFSKEKTDQGISQGYSGGEGGSRPPAVKGCWLEQAAGWDPRSPKAPGGDRGRDGAGLGLSPFGHQFQQLSHTPHEFVAIFVPFTAKFQPRKKHKCHKNPPFGAFLMNFQMFLGGKSFAKLLGIGLGAFGVGGTPLVMQAPLFFEILHFLCIFDHFRHGTDMMWRGVSWDTQYLAGCPKLSSL